MSLPFCTRFPQHADDSSQYDYSDFKSLTLDEPQQAQQQAAAARRVAAQQQAQEEGLPPADREGSGREDQEGVVGQGE